MKLYTQLFIQGILIALFLNPTFSGNKTDSLKRLFQFEYKLNENAFKKNTSGSISICDGDELTIRLFSNNQPTEKRQFHVWKSPGGHLDYGVMRIPRNTSRYGTYRVEFNFEGTVIRKELNIFRKVPENCDTTTCKIQGFWSGMDRPFDTYYDINNFQIIIRQNKSAAECPVKYLFNYYIDGDTLVLSNIRFQNIRLLADLKSCDAMHLTDLNNTGLIANQTIVLNRIKDMACDCPANYIMTPNFFRRELPAKVSLYLCIFLYLSLLVAIIYLLFKGNSKWLRYNLFLGMGLICFYYSFFEFFAFYLFCIHALIYVKFILRSIPNLNSIGTLVLYAAFSGLLSVLSFYMIFGLNEDVITWSSPLNLIVMVIGFSLIYGFVKDGIEYSNIKIGYLFLSGFLILALVQGSISLQRFKIIKYFQTKMPKISYEDEEVCPGPTIEWPGMD